MNAVLALLASAPERHAKCKEREVLIDAAIVQLQDTHRRVMLELEVLRREATPDDDADHPTPHA